MVDIVGVGHACYDNLCMIREYPSEDTASHISDMKIQGGGAASQALVTASRLGGTAGYIGYLGDDQFGKYLLNDYTKENIDTGCIKTVPGGKTSVSFILTSGKTGQRTIFYYPGKLPDLTIDGDAEKMISGAKYLHLDATNYNSALAAARIAKRHNVKVSLDGCEVENDTGRTKELIALTDVLITNKTYPEEVTGCADLKKAMGILAGLGPELVVTTRGADGAYALRGGKFMHFPAYDFKPKDSTGAGDSFHGAFIYCLLHNYPLNYCVKFASAVSAINCMTFGGRDGLPTLSQTLEYIKTHDYDESGIYSISNKNAQDLQS